MADIKALGDQLVELTVKEVNELASYLKETLNKSPKLVKYSVDCNHYQGAH